MKTLCNCKRDKLYWLLSDAGDVSDGYELEPWLDVDAIDEIVSAPCECEEIRKRIERESQESDEFEKRNRYEILKRDNELKALAKKMKKLNKK